MPTTQQITSRFDGVIKKLYYEADEVAKVGKVSFQGTSTMAKTDGRSHWSISTSKAKYLPLMRQSLSRQRQKFPNSLAKHRSRQLDNLQKQVLRIRRRGNHPSIPNRLRKRLLVANMRIWLRQPFGICSSS